MFLCAVVFVASAALWSARIKVTTISQSSEIALIEIPENDWQNACFAPAYHYLDRTEFDVGPSACWNGKEVPVGWTYLTFYSRDGSCEKYRFQGDFIVPNGGDYRCFPKMDNEDIQIDILEGILRLR